jgi:hypothetical protein
VSIYEDFSNLMNLKTYYLEDGRSIDSVVILWIETLMTLELLRRNNIHLIELFSFDIFRYKQRESTSNNRAIIIDLTKFEEIDPDRLDLYKIVLYESVKEMTVKFKSSFYIPTTRITRSNTNAKKGNFRGLVQTRHRESQNSTLGYFSLTWVDRK